MKDSQQPSQISFSALVELATKARALDEPWVQRALFAVAATNDPVLAHAVVMKLRLRAAIEVIDPFPFDIPMEEEEFV